MVNVLQKQARNTSAIFKFKVDESGLVGKIYFRKTFNNIFLTFTDINNKVVSTISGGRCSPNNNKRLKKAAHAMPLLIAKLVPIFHYYEVSCFVLCLKSKGGWFLTTIIEELEANNFTVYDLQDSRKRAHNGVRARKPRRV